MSRSSPPLLAVAGVVLGAAFAPVIVPVVGAPGAGLRLTVTHLTASCDAAAAAGTFIELRWQDVPGFIFEIGWASLAHGHVSTFPGWGVAMTSTNAGIDCQARPNVAGAIVYLSIQYYIDAV